MGTQTWLLVVGCVLLVMFWCWSRRRLWYLASKIPGPNGFPLIGSALSIPRGNEHFVSFLRNFQTENFPTVKLWIGPWVWVAVSDPDDIEVVLKSTKCLDRTFLKDILDCGGIGDGLVSLSGEKWAHHRKVIVPTFKLGILKQFINVFQTKSFELVDILLSEAHGDEINMFDLLCSYSLQMVCSTIMGVDVEKSNVKLIRYFKSMRDLKIIAINIATQPWLFLECKLPFTKLAKKVKKLSNNIIDLSNFLVSEKICSVKKQQLKTKIKSEKGNLAFLDQLVESLFSEAPLFTEDEIRGETVSMIVDGYETISSANSFALMLLAFHQVVQERAFQELLDIFGSNKRRSATFQDLQEMTYLEQIIKETLRLYPSVPYSGRGVTEEIQIKDYTLPVGSIVFINFLVTQRNLKYFTNPHKFDPDNFSPERKLAQHPFAFTPFSHGPRMCVGSKYAMLQMKVMLSTILRHYQLLPVGKLEDLERLEASLTLFPSLGVKLRLIPRIY